MAIKESYVRVKEVVVKTPSASSVGNSSNVAGVIVAPVGPKLAYITSPSEFLATYTKDGETIPRNADITFINAYYLSYFSGLVLTRSLNTNAIGGLAVTKSSTIPIIYKDNQLLRKESRVTLVVNRIANVDGTYDESNWQFMLNDYGFYKGVSPDESMENDADLSVKVDSIESIGAALESFDEFHVKANVIPSNNDPDKIRVELIIKHNLTGNIEISHLNSSITVETYTSTDGVFVIPSTDIVGDTSEWMFTVKGDLPLANNGNKLKIKNTSSSSESFILTLNGVQYVVSLNPDLTDSNGVNLYIEYINTQNTGFEIEVYNNFTEQVNETTTRYLTPDDVDTAFGESDLDLTACKSDANINAALSYLADQEVYDVEYLAPFGLTSPSVIGRLLQVSRDKKWFCPIDIPSDCTSYTEVKRESELISSKELEIGEGIPGSIVLGPFDRNTTLTGWRNNIAASTLYFERVMANKSQNAEFAPVFKSSYGTLNYSNPAKLFLKSERENLLSLKKPVNWVVYDQKSMSYYLNDNRTRMEDQTSVVCEEQNARIVWKISKDIDRILDQFISQYNTKATRARVVDVLDYYFQWSIMNQQFPPDAYEITCDESINPPEVINANKLAVIVKVRLYKAIKYIEVINKVYPLGVDFNQSI